MRHEERKRSVTAGISLPVWKHNIFMQSSVMSLPRPGISIDILSCPSTVCSGADDDGEAAHLSLLSVVSQVLFFFLLLSLETVSRARQDRGPVGPWAPDVCTDSESLVTGRHATVDTVDLPQ